MYATSQVQNKLREKMTRYVHTHTNIKQWTQINLLHGAISMVAAAKTNNDAPVVHMYLTKRTEGGCTG